MRRLIVCVDGGWDDSVPRHSSILHLLRSIESSDTRSTPPVMQFAHYATAHFDTSLFSQLLGYSYASFSHLLFELYAFLSMNYTEDSQILLFGYSKGAYMVRILAAFINDIGILPRDDLTKFHSLLHAYFDRKAGAPHAHDILKPWLLSSPTNTRHKHQQYIITCLGLFDCTVQSQPSLLHRKIASISTPESFLGLPDALLGERIQYAYHAVALHENRRDVRHLRMISRGEPGQRSKQVWFNGSSGDIGGVCALRELSDIARVWMASQVSPLLALNKEVLLESIHTPMFRYGIQPPHNPHTAKLTTLMPVKRRPHLVHTHTHQELIHSSVLAGSLDLAEPLVAAIERNTALIDDLEELEDDLIRQWTVDARDAARLVITYAIDHKHYDEVEKQTWFDRLLYSIQLVVVYFVLVFLGKVEMLFGLFA